MCQMERKLINGLAFILLSSSVLQNETHDEKLVLKVDATETEADLAPCHILIKQHEYTQKILNVIIYFTPTTKTIPYPPNQLKISIANFLQSLSFSTPIIKKSVFTHALEVGIKNRTFARLVK